VHGSPSAPAVPATGKTGVHKWSKQQQLEWRPQAIDTHVSSPGTGWRARAFCGMYISMTLSVDRAESAHKYKKRLGSQVSKQPQV